LTEKAVHARAATHAAKIGQTGVALFNPDAAKRPTNSGQTVYQMEPRALALLQSFGTDAWEPAGRIYLDLLADTRRSRSFHKPWTVSGRVPLPLPAICRVAHAQDIVAPGLSRMTAARDSCGF